MDKELYLAEVSDRLMRIFCAIKNGYKPLLIDKHRCEGFMQAGEFLGVSTNAELSELMEEIHQSVFGESIPQRRSRKMEKWQEEAIDYEPYEDPTFLR